MWNRTLWILSGLGALLALTACDGNTEQSANSNTGGTPSTIPTGTGPVALDNLPHEMAAVICNLLLRCAGAVSVEYGASSSECLNDFENKIADQTISQLSVAIAAGHMSYNPTAVRQCLDSYPLLNCDYSNEASLASSCSNAWNGNVAIGGECNSNFECASSTTTSYCASDGTCPGHCQARGSAAICSSDGQCQLGLECDSSTDTCANRFKLGELCGTSTTAVGVCGGFTKCQQASATEPFRCVNIFGATQAGEGQLCSATSGCASGLVCEATGESQDASATPLMRCQKPATIGGSCRFSYSNPCPDGQFCPVSYGDAVTATAQCTNRIAANQACTGSYVDECQGDANCSSSFCVPVQRIGGNCASSGDCYSDVCTSGLCVAPKDCSR